MIYQKSIWAWRESVPRALGRAREHVYRARFGWWHEQTVTMVFGCQRSGTSMLLRIIAKSPDTHIYHEYTSTAFWNWRLRSPRAIRALLRFDPAYSIVLKPIIESHIADQVMRDHPDANAIWIFRHYNDVANSAVAKWQDHQKQVMQANMDGRTDWNWRTERPIPHLYERVREVWSEDVSPHEAAVLFWWVRNSYFFELGLDRQPNLLLLSYKHLVSEPDRVFRKVFDHIAGTYTPALTADVHARSVGREPAPEIRPAIRALADELYGRLQGEYERRLQSW